jgi:hypothetical protein
MVYEYGSADPSDSGTCRESEADRASTPRVLKKRRVKCTRRAVRRVCVLGVNLSWQGHINGGLCATEQCLTSDFDIYIAPTM